MKRSIFTIFCTLFCSVTLFAQTADSITVSQRVLANLLGFDTRMTVNLTATTNLPSFAAATNHVWNLSTVTYDSVSWKSHRYAPLAPYNFSDSLGFQFDSLHYMAKGGNLYTTAGVQEYNQNIDTQTIFKTKMSGVMDTIAFPFQTLQYTHEYVKVPYILKYTTPVAATWKSAFTYKTTFNVTDRQLGLIKSKSTIYTTFSETDTVVGWGSMRIKTNHLDASMQPTVDTVNVLQVKTVSHKTDSIVLPNVLGVYDSLDLDTVYTHDVYAMNFYMQDALLPVVKVMYFDANYDSVIAVEVGMSDVTLGVTSIPSKVSNIKVYPNPVSNGVLHIEVPEATGIWSYQLINIVGQQVAANTLSLGNGNTHAQVSLPNVTPGVYYVRLINNNTIADVKAVVVQ